MVELEGKLEKSCSTEENQQKIIDQLKDEVETLEKKLKVIKAVFWHFDGENAKPRMCKFSNFFCWCNFFVFSYLML